MEPLLQRSIDTILAKLNTRAASLLCAFVLICSGVYMCRAGLSANGSIDLSTTLLKGKIETGSLGLMALFLGVFIVVTLNLDRLRPKGRYAGEEIKLTINGKTVVGKGLSYNKMRELLRAAFAESPRDAQELAAEGDDAREGSSPVQSR